MRKLKDPIVVKDLFDSVSKKYDFLNDLLSLGMHRLWKNKLLKLLNPSAGEKWVDLCCGTGDLTLHLARLISPKGSIIGVDFSEAQIRIATKRPHAKSYVSISWLVRDALHTSLPSESFDGIVMAYGLRNLSNPEEGLREIYRLLKPAAKAGVLDFNHPEEGSKTFLFQKLYLRNVVVPIASFMGLKDEYAYIEESINSFPKGKLLEEIAIKIGFQQAKYQLIAGGQMAFLLLKR